MGIFNTQKDRYRNYNYRFSRPSMFGGSSLFPPVIKYLLISNIIIFILSGFIFRLITPGGVPLSAYFNYYFALNPIGIKELPFYPWQLFTYLFMHANLFHIFFNMFALVMFGRELESIWGSKKFLGYYLMCGIGAGLFHLLVTPLISSLTVPTIGASGAVFGILVAFGYMFPNRVIFINFLFPVKAKYVVIFYMAISVLFLGDGSAVAHAAHLGGGLIGFVYLWMSRSRINEFFRFDKKPKVSSGRPANIYSNRYYEKYNATSEDDRNDAGYYDNKQENSVDQDKIDEILDKISREGYKNLTEEEKRILFEASRKIN